MFFPNINTPILVKPLTTVADSVRNPRPAEGPYVPYDFSQMTTFDVIAHTINNGGPVILGSCAFYFVVQFFSHFFLKAVVGKPYLQRTLAERREDCIRVVSIVNGLLATPNAILFFMGLLRHGFQIHSYHYQPLENYSINRGFIAGYFLWDTIVCIAFKWGFLWTVHGIFSFTGCFFLNFPFSDHIGCYFTGMFELTNGLLHTSALLRNYKIGDSAATIMEYIFAFLYAVIRVLGGTYCALTWMMDMFTLYQRNQLHNNTVVGFVTFSITTIMLLQYIWFSEIIKVAFGFKKRALEGEATSPKMEKNESFDAAANTVPATTTTATKRRSAAAPKE